jgi:hypothetical protein
MAHSDWVPTKEQSLVVLCEKWRAWLKDPVRVAAFGWNKADVDLILLKIDAFLTAQAAYEAVDSTAKRIAKDEAKVEAVSAMRNFANFSIRFNKNMDDAQKFVLGVHPKAAPTNRGKPDSQPYTEINNTVNRFEHKIRALNRVGRGSSKPIDVYGVRYAWQVGGEKPESGEDLPKSKFSRKTSITIAYTEADKAKTAYYSTCYENGKGEAGPWSPIEEAVIS